MSNGYILRISTNEYERRVFADRCYYAGVSRRWEVGDTVFFVRKGENRDSIIGHGVLEEIRQLAELHPKEREECIAKRWRCKLSFGSKLERYREPITVVDAFGVGMPRGNRIHGYRLTQAQRDAMTVKNWLLTQKT